MGGYIFKLPQKSTRSRYTKQRYNMADINFFSACIICKKMFLFINKESEILEQKSRLKTIYTTVQSLSAGFHTFEQLLRLDRRKAKIYAFGTLFVL